MMPLISSLVEVALAEMDDKTHIALTLGRSRLPGTVILGILTAAVRAATIKSRPVRRLRSSARAMCGAR